MTFLSDASGAQPGQYPALGFDPAPGDLAAIDAMFQTFMRASGDLDNLREWLDPIGKTEGIWEGAAALEFSLAVAELPKKADDLRESLDEANGELTSWRNTLEEFQARARDLERQAEVAKERLASARRNPDLDLAGQYFSNEDAFREAQRRLQAAVDELNRWYYRLQELRDQARGLFDLHQLSAVSTANAIKDIYDKGFFGGLGDMISGAFGAAMGIAGTLVGATYDFIKEHADLIKEIGDVLGDVALYAGIVALGAAVVATGGAAAPALIATYAGYAALSVGAGAFAAHGVAALGGADVGTSTLLFDAVGMIPGVGRLGSLSDDAARLVDAGFGVSVGIAGKEYPEATTDSISLGDLVPQVGYAAGRDSVESAAGTVWDAFEVGAELAGARAW